MFTPFDRRMKAYEKIYNYSLSSELPIVLRLDGKAFHSWTKKLEKPICSELETCFLQAIRETVKKIQYVTFAYYQSDEVSFIIRNDLTEKGEPWMQNRIQKFTSVITSMFTYYFNKYANLSFNNPQPAFFDCRVFNLPVYEITNYLIWRQNDCKRNIIQGFAQKYIGKKKIKGLSTQILLEELKSKNVFLKDFILDGYALYKVNFDKDNTTRHDWEINSAYNFIDNREHVFEILSSLSPLFYKRDNIEDISENLDTITRNKLFTIRNSNF